MTGVVLVTKFTMPFAEVGQVYSDYLDYMRREEAIRDLLKEYDEYTDYMANPMKSSGMFSETKDHLSAKDIEKYKHIMDLAQINGSPLWQSVLSFDNEFLAENGIYDKKTGTVNEAKLKELTRGCMQQMLMKEGISNSAVWTGSIHYNTDNIHIHMAAVEPFPQRERILNGEHKGEIKGTFKLESIKAGKRFVANNIVDTQQENKLINDIIRNHILEKKKERPLIKDKELAQKFMEIHSKLPTDKRTWQYSMNAMAGVRPELDELTSLYLEKYHKEDFAELKKVLDQQEKRYKEIYGAGSKEVNNFAKNKVDDLYKRMGNVILKEMKEYDREQRKIAYEEAVKSKGKNIKPGDLQIYVYKENSHTDGKSKTSSFDRSENSYTTQKADGGTSKDKPPKKAGTYRAKTASPVFQYHANMLYLMSSMEKFKRALDDKYQHIKNQQEYEKLLQQEEQEGQVKKNQETEL